jgi:hypothetical protein
MKTMKRVKESDWKRMGHIKRQDRKEWYRRGECLREMSLLKSQKRREHASETSKWLHKMKSYCKSCCGTVGCCSVDRALRAHLPDRRNRKNTGKKKGMLKKDV